MMTGKRRPSLNEEERRRFRQIKTRLQGADTLALWASCPGALRHRVIGELELAHQQAAGDTALADALTLALEVLDVVGVEGAAGMSEAARDDIRWLLARVAD